MHPTPHGGMPSVHRLASVPIVLLAAALTCGVESRAERPQIYAITGARVMTAPGRVLDEATVVLRDGLIESVGRGVPLPADAFVIDGTGKTVTAGFIDGCSDIGQQKQESGGDAGRGGIRAGSTPQPAGTVHPIPRVRPETKVIDSLVTDTTAFEKHRAMGFTTVLALPGSGIFRGEAALVNLGDGPPSTNVLAPRAGQVVAFETGRFGEGYPASLMGCIATIRQTLIDTSRHREWSTRYAASPRGMKHPDHVEAFEALEGAASGRDPILFDVPESENLMRAMAIADEFGLQAVIVGSGLEHIEMGVLDALTASKRPIILPLAYPEKPKVDDPDEALAVTLQDLERWDAAPANPAKVKEAGVAFALGTCRLPGAAEFPSRLRQAIAQGLGTGDALAALTTEPARILGVDSMLGTVEAGKIANLVVFENAPADGAGVFDEKATPRTVFVDGVKFEVEKRKSKGDPNARVDPRGTWSVTFAVGGRTINRIWTIAGSEGSYSGTAETQAGTVEFSSVNLKGNEMTVVIPGRGGRPDQEVVAVITGDSLEGGGDFPGGASYSIKGTRTSGPEGGSL